jgi:hypothetical protein
MLRMQGHRDMFGSRFLYLALEHTTVAVLAGMSFSLLTSLCACSIGV